MKERERERKGEKGREGKRDIFVLRDPL